MTRILYVIPHRALNSARDQNLKLTLEWLLKLKHKLRFTGLHFKILVIEQDRVSHFQSTNSKIKHRFLINPGVFNKGWAFNVAVREHPHYDYYAFGDSDIILPEISGVARAFIQHCHRNPELAFRPFRECLATSEKDLSRSDITISKLIDRYRKHKLTLEARPGLNFAGGLIVIKRSIYEQINGWDESFAGWGRHDDFMGHILRQVAQCPELILPFTALHLWHPITPDFSLKPEIVTHYDTLMTLDQAQLLERILLSRGRTGRPNLYSNQLKSN